MKKKAILNYKEFSLILHNITLYRTN